MSCPNTIEEKIAAYCIEHQMTVSTAESCTGGLVAAQLINVAGVSEIFREGYITYANEAKERLLGVSHETLSRYGAVSPQTASEMAAGCAKASGSDFAIVTTGIAGPGGGSHEKPVGLVYLGCHALGQTETRECRLVGSRQTIRREAAQRALEFLYEHMGEKA